MNPFSTRKSWRDDAQPRIAAVIERVGRQDMAALRRALRDAYPYGDRENWPYKVWCSEVRRQLSQLRIPAGHQPDPRQQSLFAK